MSPEPTTPVEEQTPAQTAETVQTPAPKAENKEELMPKAEVTRLLKKQAAELTAKYKPFEEKAAKLDEIEQAGKSELEKTAGRVTKLEKELADKDAVLSAKDLKLTKILTLLRAGATIDPEHPEQLDDLVDRIRGSTPEEVASDVEKMKGWGWIGQKAAPPEPSKGLGTQTKTGDQLKTRTLQDQLNEANTKLHGPKISYSEKTALIDLTLQLNRRISKGET